MTPPKYPKRYATFIRLAEDLAKTMDADALLVMVDERIDWTQLKKTTGERKVVLVAESKDVLEGSEEAGFAKVVLKDMSHVPIFEKLSQALLESIADDILQHGAEVVAVFSAIEAGKIDSISFLRLGEHLGRLTSRDLQSIETKVPLDTLKLVLDLAIEIGRDGREGKAVGTIFVVGDHRKVLELSHPLGFDPVFGYKRKELSLKDPKVREAVKEVAQLDGAFVVSSEGTVLAAAQMLPSDGKEVTISKGLGTRHTAAATITKSTKSIAIVVSESNGTVRLFQNGEIILRVEPLHRAMIFREFNEPESPPDSE